MNRLTSTKTTSTHLIISWDHQSLCQMEPALAGPTRRVSEVDRRTGAEAHRSPEEVAPERRGRPE